MVCGDGVECIGYYGGDYEGCVEQCYLWKVWLVYIYELWNEGVEEYQYFWV